MESPVLADVSADEPQAAAGRRHYSPALTRMRLTEIEPDSVLDHLHIADVPEDGVILSGQMREDCPKCKAAKLQLVLRQKTIKTPHLLCPACASCFDARYANGTCALAL